MRVGQKARGEHLPRDNPKLYEIWQAMRKRCENQNDKSYYLYGARGIRVCGEWQKFKPFYEWAITHGYDPDMQFGKCTIDRIDSNGDYSPDNCRWVDMNAQNRNKRSNRAITYGGKTQLAVDWSKELGIPQSTITARLSKGYSIEETLFHKRYSKTREVVPHR